jgi:hypothetical protein
VRPDFKLVKCRLSVHCPNRIERLHSNYTADEMNVAGKNNEVTNICDMPAK